MGNMRYSTCNVRHVLILEHRVPGVNLDMKHPVLKCTKGYFFSEALVSLD